MDTVTQMALGAAVGEVTLGDRAGNRAIYWGAAAGIIPDLDIIVGPFVSEVQGLTMHRAFSHSLLFIVLFSPLLGAAIQRTHGLKETSWKGWSILSFWVLLTHVVLDCLTTYGTQIFQPFSSYKVSLSTVFVIDPLYTVPLLVGVIAAARQMRGTAARHRAIYLGIGLSSLYLLFAAGMKLHARTVFEDALDRGAVPYDRLKTVPTPFNSLLWMGMAEGNDTVRVGLYSVFDDDRSVSFRTIPRSTQLLDGLRDEREVERLIWFSEGYYAVDERDGQLYFHDLRFGRNDVWLTDEGAYIFTWKLARADDSSDEIAGIRHQPDRGFNGSVVRAFIRRIFGNADEGDSRGDV